MGNIFPNSGNGLDSRAYVLLIVWSPETRIVIVERKKRHFQEKRERDSYRWGRLLVYHYVTELKYMKIIKESILHV